jgi:ribosomal-protein-serine acetyltransferase
VLTTNLTDHAHLRLLEEHDAAELYAVIDQNRDYLARWMPWARTQTVAATLEFIRLTRQQLADNNGLQTAIIVNHSIAGLVGLHAISWPNRSTSIGYWLAEEHQGLGLATAAVRAYLEYVFTTLPLGRITLSAAVDNARSRALAERTGFRQEGVLRQAEVVNGRAHDLALYALLREEWES